MALVRLEHYTQIALALRSNVLLLQQIERIKKMYKINKIASNKNR